MGKVDTEKVSAFFRFDEVFIKRLTISDVYASVSYYLNLLFKITIMKK